jgi:prevent-host-death family protein
MREVQATVAKARLAEIIRDVERGESITITRNGKKVALLVPIEDEERIQREKAMDRFMESRSQWQPTGMSAEEILAVRHEGHRF